MNLGRAGNADPRWLVPFLCRRGEIHRSDIGEIQILEGETLFEIARPVADRFAESVRRRDGKHDGIRIEAFRARRGRGSRRAAGS